MGVACGHFRSCDQCNNRRNINQKSCEALSKPQKTFRDPTARCPRGNRYRVCRHLTNVGVFFSYQALWDLQPESLYGRLGEDIALWMKCLNDIKYVHLITSYKDTLSDEDNEINRDTLQ